MVPVQQWRTYSQCGGLSVAAAQMGGALQYVTNPSPPVDQAQSELVWVHCGVRPVWACPSCVGMSVLCGSVTSQRTENTCRLSLANVLLSYGFPLHPTWWPPAILMSLHMSWKVILPGQQDGVLALGRGCHSGQSTCLPVSNPGLHAQLCRKQQQQTKKQ